MSDDPSRYLFGWIEEPFPWILVGGVVAAALLLEVGVFAAINQFFDVDAGF
jgi:hypothetical protein